MKNPGAWIDFRQCPEFDEYNLVLRGALHGDTRSRTIVVRDNEAALSERGA